MRVLAVVTAAIGVYLMGVGLAGFLFRPLGWFARSITTLAGLMLIPPPSTGLWIVSNLIGLILGAGFVAWQWQANSLQPPQVAGAKDSPRFEP